MQKQLSLFCCKSTLSLKPDVIYCCSQRKLNDLTLLSLNFDKSPALRVVVCVKSQNNAALCVL